MITEASGSFEPSLPTDLAKEYKEKTGRSSDAETRTEFFQTLRHEIYSRAGDYFQKLMDQAAKEPNLDTMKLAAQIEADQTLTIRQKEIFQTGVTLAAEDHGKVNVIKDDLRKNARRYLAEIYGQESPFAKEAIERGDPTVLGAIIFAQKTGVPPRGRVELTEHPLVVELIIEKAGDFNEIYDPATDVQQPGHHLLEVKSQARGFYRETEQVLGVGPIPMIVSFNYEGLQKTRDHEFGHYLENLTERIFTRMAAGQRKLTVEKNFIIRSNMSYLETRYPTLEDAEKERCIAIYTHRLGELNTNLVDYARSELVADFNESNDFSKTARGLRSQQRLDLIGVWSSGYDYYYRMLGSERWSTVPENLKPLVIASREKYREAIDDPIRTAEETVTMFNYFGIEKQERGSLFALMLDNKLERWPMRLQETFGQELAIYHRFQTVFGALDKAYQTPEIEPGLKNLTNKFIDLLEKVRAEVKKGTAVPKAFVNFEEVFVEIETAAAPFIHTAKPTE